MIVVRVKVEENIVVRSRLYFVMHRKKLRLKDTYANGG